MVRVIMVCFKRQMWFQNRILISWRGVGLVGEDGMVHGRCSVKLVLGTGVIPCHDRCWTLVFFFVWKENSRGDSDEYHRFLQFLILDLHKSEVGPSNFFFFFFFFFLFENEIFI